MPAPVVDRAPSRRKSLVYVVLGLVAVVAVLAMWSSMDRAVPGNDAVVASGERYDEPWIRTSSSDAVVVSYTVRPAPDAGDRVTVRAASPVLVVDGVDHQPVRQDRDERISTGGPVGFSATFEVSDVEPGSTVDLQLTAADGTRYEFTDVEVDERLRRPARP